MKRVHTGRTLGVAFLAAAVMLPTTSAPVALAAPARQAAVGECVNGWQELQIPEGSLGSVPTEAVTYDGSLAWILGTTNEGVLSLRWNGQRLVPVAAVPGKRRGLASAIAKNRSALLGVGFQRPRARRIRGISGRLAGQRWVGQPLPPRHGAQTTLADIVKLPSGKLWAVGASLKGGFSGAMALRRQDGTWRNADPAGGKNGSALLGVTRSPGGVVWAVGWRERGGRARPLIARRRGSSWALSGGAWVPGGTAVLTDLAFRSGSDGWAVGYLMRTGSSDYEPILERWNGKTWDRVPLSWADGPSSIPRSISVAKDGSLLIGGVQLATDSREGRGFVARRQAGAKDAWQVTLLDTPDDLGSVITSVASIQDGAVAVGTVGYTAFAMQTCKPGIAVAGRRKIGVSKIKRRRTFTGPHVLGPRGPAIDVANTGASVRLKSPVAPSGFTIRDVASDVGLHLSTRTWGATTGDFDDDGWKDVDHLPSFGPQAAPRSWRAKRFHDILGRCLELHRPPWLRQRRRER